MNPSVGITIGIVRQHTSGRRFHVKRVSWSEQPAILKLAAAHAIVHMGLAILLGVQLPPVRARTLVVLLLCMVPVTRAEVSCNKAHHPLAAGFHAFVKILQGMPNPGKTELSF